jgi:DnaJ-class molecular chaperone
MDDDRSSYYDLLHIDRRATPSDVEHAYAKVEAVLRDDSGIASGPGRGSGIDHIKEAYNVSSSE